MKRTVAMLFAVLLAVAVAFPAMASTTTYSDLPSNHWAVEAVRTLTAIGILEGYPDGTFKGPQATTRYELAMVIARLLKYLDQEISARIAAVEAKIPAATVAAPVPTPTPVPTPAPVTTVVQVEPDQTILETIIREKIEEITGPQFEDIDERIAELYAMIQDLKAEFARELSVLGVRVTALEGQMAQVNARLAKDEADILKNKEDIAALKLQLDPAIARIGNLERRSDAIEKELANLNQALAKMGAQIVPFVPAPVTPVVTPVVTPAPVTNTTVVQGASVEEVEALKALMVASEKDKAALAARVTALENKAPQVVTVTTPAPVTTPVVTPVVSAPGVSPAELAEVKAMVLKLEAGKVDVLMSRLGALESKVISLESKLNTVDTRVGNLELRVSDVEAKVAGLEGRTSATELKVSTMSSELGVVAKQAGQNATDIVDLYNLNYRNADDIAALKAELAAKFAELEKKYAANADAMLSEVGLTKEGVALLKLDILEAQDDIEKLKGLFAQVEGLNARLDAIEIKQNALDEKVALLNMDLAALESEKVDNALLRAELLEGQTADLYEKYGMLESRLNGLALDVKQNTDDINDLYIKQNTTTNLLKNLAAADVALNDRVAAIEAANKISADELNAKVNALTAASAASKAEELSLKNSLLGLTDKLSNLWINKFLLSGSFEIAFKDVAVMMGSPFSNPFDNTSTAITPSNSYQAKLSLTGTIKPEPGVEINVGMNAGIDVYGLTDTSATIFNGDLDIKVTSPNGYGQIIGGEQVRPKFLNKYVFSSILFGDEKFEGLGGWAKYTPGTVDGLVLGASAIVAKKGSTTDFRYVWGAAVNANYMEAADLTLYYFAVDDRPFSGDIPGVYDGNEKHIGVNLDFALGENWSAGAFANLFIASWNPNLESAITAYIEGKAGVWSFSTNFERVSDDYDPMYAEFVDTDDPDIIENDIMNLTMSNSFAVLPNLVFGLDTELLGDDDWANLTHVNEVYAKWTFGQPTGYFNGSLKLYGGREADIVVGSVWNVPVPDADGQCYAGADLKLKLFVFDAGFSYYTETYDIAGVYAGIMNKYTAYVNTNLTLIPDVLTAKAGWKGVFGDFAGNYQEAYGELKLNTNFAVKWNLAATLGAYFKSTTMFKVYADAKLTYNMSPTASFYAMAAGEYRNSLTAAPDGFVLSAGVGYSQKIFSNTSLVADFTTKYVKYTFNPGGYSDNLVNTLGIKLSTKF